MLRRKAWALAAFLPFLVFGATYPVAFGYQAGKDGVEIPVKSMVLDTFKQGAGPRFGKLEFLGGLVMATTGGELGAISSIRLLPDREHFIAIMDTGHWATGRIERDPQGRLSGIGTFAIHTMVPDTNSARQDHESMDAEGMVLARDRIYVSFERDHRILAYPYPGFEDSAPVASERPVTGGVKLRGNGGIEALLAAPADSALAGSLFFVAERTYDEKGNFVAGIHSGPLKGNFRVRRSGDYDVTDGVVLDDGTFLLLERKFGLKSGIGMRIRRFSIADVKPDALIDGEVLLEADFSHQIDNMEGLDAFRTDDGALHLIVTSDDNHSLLERNLMLEFKLLQ
ncbi:esterase-like activity of phytase family protein [Rhizobium alvei]|uniref:Esterase-like activity of phytase family protein n=1 Tax=Rhizobium alvei TaxID=1132659 RepID=A0ABT8YQM2_9HYPH|nr:esterase-like activity of phytase family protein [Rhizobium alvei]MDO6965485.1 esterase-like activity of phytase family protein [Rhizobium alvei]